jgi:hypothetical protein
MSEIEKMALLQVHIRWAEEHGALTDVDTFLRGLADGDWHYLTY